MFHPARRLSAIVGVTALLTGGGVLAGCSSSTPQESVAGGGDTTPSSELWDSTAVHSITVDYDEDDYDAMIQAYLDTGDKEWIEATVVIDGETYDDVGLKLKGNSSLRGLSTDADASLSSTRPEDLPWLIDLDKYVDGQSHDGSTELVVRGSSSETALNEAVALELLAETGLAAEEAIAVRFSADGSDETLRLVVENPDDSWVEREFGADDALYKAEAGGDYSYRGDDPAAYDGVFDQEAGDDDLQPLIDFLKFVDESDDATFAAELSNHLDVEAFATYLAFQELIDNFDDIDGPGNNSYLAYDSETGRMTVVSWDLNLAFGQSNVGGGGGRGGNGGGGNGGMPGGGGGNGGGPSNGNILSERFLADDDFHAMYEDALTTLTAQLYTSGDAQRILDTWVQTLKDGASDLVPASTIDDEAAAIAAKLTS